MAKVRDGLIELCLPLRLTFGHWGPQTPRPGGRLPSWAESRVCLARIHVTKYIIGDAKLKFAIQAGRFQSFFGRPPYASAQ